MSKAITGAAELAGAAVTGVAMAALASTGVGLAALPALTKVMTTLAIQGIATEVGALGDALAGNRGMQIAARQPAANRTIIYGTQMMGGVYADMSTSGHQYNRLIMIAAHQIHSIQAIYLDGRKIIFKGSGNGWSVRNGVGFGGDADSNDHIGPDGVTKYNFGGKVFVEARYGDQAMGDYMTSLAGNDHTFGPDATTGDCPSFVGNAYIYVKVTSDANMFPQPPEIRVLVNGKSDILDPRTGQRGFTNNSALVLADYISNTDFGIGDSNIDQSQLIAAANICDEQIPVAAISGNELRYCTDYSFDTGTSPADVMETMRANMNALVPQIGGVWTIIPGAYVAPSMHLDKSAFTAPIDWTPKRSTRDIVNRVLATHIAAEYPYSVSGNWYQNHSGTPNTFDLKFTQSSVPYYSRDVRHGYPADQSLTEDGGQIKPMSMAFPAALSMTQCQRLMKQALMQQRAFQGEGTFEIGLKYFGLSVGDTFTCSMAEMSWSNKLFQVVGSNLFIDNETMTVRYQIKVREHDASMFAWSTSEELTQTAAPAAPSQTPWNPVAPTNMQLASGPATVITQPDGSAVPAIRVTWDTPLDNAATSIQVQYAQTGTGIWWAGPSQDISLNGSLIVGVIAGQTYNVRIRTVRASGATSDWVEQDNFVVPTLNTFLGTLGPVAYAGMSESLVPNGGFVLGSPQGWVTVDGGSGTWIFEQPPDGARIHLVAGQQDGVSSTAFSVLPGAKYRISFRVYASSPGAQSTYLRILGTANPVANVLGTNYTTITDFIGNGAISPTNQWLDKTYDWTCPAGVNYASILIHNWTGNSSDIYVQKVTCVPYMGVGDWGADVTTDQPIVYAGISGNLVPNGDFLKLTDQGWLKIGATAFDPGAPQLFLAGGQACSPAFGVIPGNKYRMTFQMQSTGGVTNSVLLRLNQGASYYPNITDQSPTPGFIRYGDFGSVSVPGGTRTTFTYDWTCPSDVHFCSLAVFNFDSSGTSMAIFRVGAQDYMGMEWGADVTGNNTSNNTNNVGSIDAGSVAGTINPGGGINFNHPGNTNQGLLSKINQANTNNIVAGAVNAYVAFGTNNAFNVPANTQSTVASVSIDSSGGYVVLTAIVSLALGAVQAILFRGSTQLSTMNVGASFTVTGNYSGSNIYVDTSPDPSQPYTLALVNSQTSAAATVTIVRLLADHRKV